MKLGISVDGIGSRMARARSELTREQAIGAALEELARRARVQSSFAAPTPASDSAPAKDTQPPRS